MRHTSQSQGCVYFALESLLRSHMQQEYVLGVFEDKMPLLFILQLPSIKERTSVQQCTSLFAIPLSQTVAHLMKDPEARTLPCRGDCDCPFTSSCIPFILSIFALPSAITYLAGSSTLTIMQSGQKPCWHEAQCGPCVPAGRVTSLLVSTGLVEDAHSSAGSSCFALLDLQPMLQNELLEDVSKIAKTVRHFTTNICLPCLTPADRNLKKCQW
jgi:hypothetical protein